MLLCRSYKVYLSIVGDFTRSTASKVIDRIIFYGFISTGLIEGDVCLCLLTLNSTYENETAADEGEVGGLITL